VQEETFCDRRITLSITVGLERVHGLGREPQGVLNHSACPYSPKCLEEEFSEVHLHDPV
jgi:hypothetical protein